MRLLWEAFRKWSLLLLEISEVLSPQFGEIYLHVLSLQNFLEMNQEQIFSWDFSYILASFFPGVCLQAPQEEADENCKKISGKIDV